MIPQQPFRRTIITYTYDSHNNVILDSNHIKESGKNAQQYNP
ncbi:hypothetical protein [Capnocytophaga sp.]|nr:hypothetical protein [Capnocytophaga sp.]MDO5106536.1 hypothetical protein [Capnocytophaga sp.]